MALGHPWVLTVIILLQFQGKWYALGVAENTVQNGSQREFKMFSDTYELKEDHSYNLTTRLLR